MNQWRYRVGLGLLGLAILVGIAGGTRAQLPAQTGKGVTDDELKPVPPGKAPGPESPAAQIDVKPKVSDDQIADRLEKILKATPDWFYEPDVEVQEGVAFLRGSTETDERKQWAGDLARSTQDVVAVVNLIDVIQPSVWDFRPALNGIYDLWRTSVRHSPWLLFCLGIIVLAYLAARLTNRLLLILFRRRFGSQLLRGVAAWIGGALVMLFGLYVVLYVSGLTRLALTVLGGTGLVGLVLGIGFRDITENFLASIFLSVQTPFLNGDLVEINGVMGIVQRMNVRTTLLMTFEGNHVQIPNSAVYKSTIINYTSSPNRRTDFTVGVAYSVDVAKAQEIALSLLHDHPAVLEDPEPMVLAEEFATSAVTLRVYFWVNVEEHSWMRVKSALIRLIKQAFNEHGITIPFETRELVFPQGVPVQMSEQEGRARQATSSVPAPHTRSPVSTREGAMATLAEGGLASEKGEIQQQADLARPSEEGEDLLRPAETEENGKPAEANKT